MSTKFAELSIQEDMMKAIEEIGYTEATPVQAETIPLTRTGADILAQSRTGTGKTMAFAIPAAERIEAGEKSIQVIVLSPTRELAQQCGEEIRKLTKYMPHIETADIFGGADYSRQFKMLKKANIIIGTPGRVMDHMKRGTLQLNKLKMIILDEADEMLNMGFKEDIETILKGVPEERQTVLFSATIPKGIKDIAKQFQKNPKQINLVKDQATLTAIEQLYVDVPKGLKHSAMKLLMRYHNPKRAIVFTNTKSMVDELTEELCGAGLLAQGIHGDMKQSQRSNVMASFKKGKTEILVATDVAARGIDVNDIEFVFNYDIPRMTEYYVHRIGRTGRAGKTGTAITLCCGNNQIGAIRMLAKRTQSVVTESQIPTVAMIKDKEKEKSLGGVQRELSKGVNPKHQESVQKLIEFGYSAEDVAAALMGIAFDYNTNGLHDLPPTKQKGKRDRDGREDRDNRRDRDSRRDRDGGEKKPREERKKLTTNIVVNIGASSKCRADHIIGSVTENTGLSSKQIGKIEIDDDHSTIEVPTELANDIIFQMKKKKICGKKVTMMEAPEEKRKQPGHKPRHKHHEAQAYRPRTSGKKKKNSNGSGNIKNRRSDKKR